MPSISILLVAIIFITLYFLWPRDYDPAKHGTWSNMIQATASMTCKGPRAPTLLSTVQPH